MASPLNSSVYVIKNLMIYSTMVHWYQRNAILYFDRDKGDEMNFLLFKALIL